MRLNFVAFGLILIGLIIVGIFDSSFNGSIFHFSIVYSVAIFMGIIAGLWCGEDSSNKDKVKK